MSGRKGVLLVAVVGLLFVAGWLSANVGAAPPPPTLAILSPADHAVIGDGSPLVIVFAVQNFNLTEPGTVGPGPASNEGHVNVSVDGNLTAVVSQPTVVLALDSGTYQVLLRLVSDNGTPLTPDVTASITVTLTRGPPGTPRIAITYWEIFYPFRGDLWGDDITISFRITNFTLVPPGRRESVPNEGRVRVPADGPVFQDITSYDPAHLSDLPDADAEDGGIAAIGTRVIVHFLVSDFLLVQPGRLGQVVAPNEGHLIVFVDGAMTRLLAQVEPIELPLASGPHTILLRLVGNDGAPLTPGVSASLPVVATQGPAGSIPRGKIVSPIPDERTGHGVYISFQGSNFSFVEPHGQPNAPNEGHLLMIPAGD